MYAFTLKWLDVAAKLALIELVLAACNGLLEIEK
jgi:hypothetical protein